jgi:hypothetical protein
MFKFMRGLPADVMAVEARGKITHEDYRDTLIPRAEATMAKGPIKLLYVLVDDISGVDPEAIWDDSTFGLAHCHDFSRIAVVTDHPWIITTINMFKPFFRGEVHRALARAICVQ